MPSQEIKITNTSNTRSIKRQNIFGVEIKKNNNKAQRNKAESRNEKLYNSDMNHGYRKFSNKKENE